MMRHSRMVLTAMVMLGVMVSALPAAIQPNHAFTWGINNQKAITLEEGQVITEAVLTFHNFRSDVVNTTVVQEISRSSFRGGGGTTTTIVTTPNYDSLKIYLLDNPRYGFSALAGQQTSDPFEGIGCPLNNGVYEGGNLVFRLGQTHDPYSYFAQLYGSASRVPLSNGQAVGLSSALLEFLDYAGTGISVGFGFWPGQVGYYYDDISLQLTVQSYQGAYSVSTLEYHITDDMTPDTNPTDTTIPEQKAYTLTIQSANGTVVCNPAKTTYAHGETVTLTATANAGYAFAGWSGDASGTASSVTLTMDGSKTVTANYTQKAYTLTIQSANGTVVCSPTKTTYAHGETVTLTATANAGYAFAGWSGDASGTASSVTLTMDGSKTVTANYTQKAYTLTIQSANGTVVCSPTKTTYAHGETVTLTATANAGYAFAGWSGDASGTASSVTLTMDGSKTVTANYTQKAYTLTIQSANGTVVCSPTKTTYAHGETVTLTATANAGYAFAGWSGDASGTASSVTLTMDGSKTVTANYTQKAYTLTIQSANGTVVCSPTKTTYAHGETVTLTATANAGYAFAGWSGDASGTASSVTLTMDGSKTVTANYTQKAYTLTIQSANGTVVCSPTKTTYAHGETVTLTATANAGYAFAGWSGDASGTASSVTLTMDGSKTVTANYTQKAYTLTIQSANGTVVCSPTKTTYAHGETVTLTATANAGYAFAGWSGDASGTASSVTLTMDGSKTVTANYVQTPEIKTAALTVSADHGTVTVKVNGTVTSATTFAIGTTVELTVTEHTGYAFTEWSGDVAGTAKTITLTLNEDTSVVANFKIVINRNMFRR